jgi:hypothetical protein
MESQGYLNFVEVFQTAMYVGIGVSIFASIAILIFHWIRAASISGAKERYDYISKNEINLVTASIYSLSAAVFFFTNTLQVETVRIDVTWLFIRLFIAACFGTLIGYIGGLIIKFVYPGVVAKKLYRLRYKPRINPKSGNRMRLLSETEEDVHLDEGMQAEERVFSVDYDVWLDEVTGDVKIEKYPGHLEAHECDRCGFQTLRLEEEQILKPATEEEEGEILKNYKCSYCGRIRRRHRKIARIRKKGEKFELPKKYRFRDEVDQEVNGVEMKIFKKDGSTRNYEFENINQAREFLEELEGINRESEEEESVSTD